MKTSYESDSVVFADVFGHVTGCVAVYSAAIYHIYVV